MTTIDEMKSRKSVRMFSAEPVSTEDRQTILECAFAAPTAGAQMLYSIIDITDQAIKLALAECCDGQGFIAQAPLVLLFLADCRRWLDAYELAGCEPRSPGLGDFYIAFCDALIAAQNTVVAAESLGLGSCYIGDVVEQPERVTALLGLDDYTFPATLVVYGHPTAQQLSRPKPARFAGQFLVHQNRYRRLSAEEQRAAFASRGQDFDSFVVPFYRRKYDSAFANEMNRGLVEYLKPFQG